MIGVTVITPVLHRADTIAPMVQSIWDTGEKPHILFVATNSDAAVIDAIHALPGDDIDLLLMEPRRNGDYATKVNYAATHSEQPVVFLGASDLKFHDGWLTAALRRLNEGFGVVGTNDLGNSRVQSGQHSTHSFVTRWYMNEYGTIDEPGKILHEGYVHEFCDDELIGTARHRHLYAWAEDSIVEHLHPFWGKAPMDRMYSDSNRRMRRSRHLFNRRRKLWT